MRSRVVRSFNSEGVRLLLRRPTVPIFEEGFKRYARCIEMLSDGRTVYPPPNLADFILRSVPQMDTAAIKTFQAIQFTTQAF